MNQKLAFAATAATVLAASGAGSVESPWNHVGSIGMRQLVVIDPAASGDAEMLKAAANSVCAPDQPCMVMFWSEEAAVPTKMPMTRAQQDAVVAQYLRNPASGSEELLLKCRESTGEGVKCLR